MHPFRGGLLAVRWLEEQDGADSEGIGVGGDMLSTDSAFPRFQLPQKRFRKMRLCGER